MCLLRWQFILGALGLVAVSPYASAQPPRPDPVFRNGFELPNQAPVADAGGNLSATVGQPLQLDGTGSFDPDGDPLEFAWRLVERPTNSGTEMFDADQDMPVLVPDRAGTYVIELVVFHGESFSLPDTATITVTGSLSASAMIGPTGGAVGLPDGASIIVPPGALGSVTTIGITEVGLPPGSSLPPTGVLAGGVYELTPGGQTFERPVQIVIPYDPDLLPPEYSEGAISIYRYHGIWPEFNMVGAGDGDEQSSSNGQILDSDSRLTMALSGTFSHYAAVGVRSSTQFLPVTLTSGNASVVVRRPPNLRTTRPVHHQCLATGNIPNNAQANLNTRTAGQIAGVVIHSTNNGNIARNFENELGWGGDDCNQSFAHYYINRDGQIFQVADDLTIAFHVAAGGFGLNNTTAIGIELFLNVGEPYDGRQITAMISLVDYLLEAYSLPRPQRNPASGIVSRNRINVNIGGDRIVAHTGAIVNKCDPSGVFMDYGVIKPEHRGVNCRHRTDPRVQSVPLSVGDSSAPALMDMLLDAMAVLDRDSQHTGLINTQGGDSFGVAQAGSAGTITIRRDAALVDTTVGTAERTRWEENEPTLLGPGPLIVAPGDTRNLTGSPHEYTDVIVAGTLNLTGDVELHVTGSVYVSPLGSIVARNGRNGGSLTVYSRGTPILQGLIDARGEDGVSGDPVGGDGGDIAFIYSAPGVLLVPTLYARGGDADTANVSLPGGGPTGGDGGDIVIEVDDGHVFLGGGVGPVVGTTRVPTWRSGMIDPGLLNQRWAGDYLPPSPPTFLSSYSIMNPPAGVRPALTWGVNDVGFARGLLTTGGMGGVGTGASAADQHGGPAGHGGAIQVTLSATTPLTLRDIDIATGIEVETITHRYYLPPPATSEIRLVCTASGAHGGFGANYGTRGGDGGSGGNAGALTLTGGTFLPAPTGFVTRGDIKAFTAGQPLLQSDPACSRGRNTIGQTVEARSAGGAALYRLRLNADRTALLGGAGGIPSGRSTNGYPGDVGSAGAEAAVTGVPVQ